MEELINRVLESTVHNVHRALTLGHLHVEKYNIWKKFVDIADPLDGPLSHITDGCKDYEDVDRGTRYDNTWSDNGSVSWSETESDIDYGCSCEKDESVNLSKKELEECIKFYSIEHTSKDEDLQGDNENGDSECNELAIFNKFNGFVNYSEKITNDDELDEFSYRNNVLVNGFSGHVNEYNRHGNKLAKGHANGLVIELVNGHANGLANGLANRHVNGLANRRANGHNGHMNGYNEHVNHRFGSGYDDGDGDVVDSKDNNKCFSKDGDKGHNKDDEGNSDEDGDEENSDEDGDEENSDEDGDEENSDEDGDEGNSDEDGSNYYDDEEVCLDYGKDNGLDYDEYDSTNYNEDYSVDYNEDYYTDDDVDDIKRNSTDANKGDNVYDSKSNSTDANKGDNVYDSKSKSTDAAKMTSKDDKVDDYKRTNKGDNADDSKNDNVGDYKDGTKNNYKNKFKDDYKREDIYGNEGDYKSTLWNCTYCNQMMAAGRLGLHRITKCKKDEKKEDEVSGRSALQKEEQRDETEAVNDNGESDSSESGSEDEIEKAMFCPFLVHYFCIHSTMFDE
ncbi:hypothetical protein TNCV_3946121, partial [Trichonephila clavipes]